MQEAKEVKIFIPAHGKEDSKTENFKVGINAIKIFWDPGIVRIDYNIESIFFVDLPFTVTIDIPKK